MSSLAVVARILGELGCRRRDVGQITVAAGMADDVVGRLLLGGIATMKTRDLVRQLQALGHTVELTPAA